MISRRQALLAVPLGVAVLGGGAFMAMLHGMTTGDFDPRGVPSPITGQHVPQFDLPSQAPGRGFSSADLARGTPTLLNFFASWCIPCAEEHPALMALSQAGAVIWAIAYKDPPEKAAQFIERRGNPYQRIAADQTGRLAIDFGLSGVPESFLIDGAGVVRWHWANGLTADIIEHRLQPAWRTVA